MIMPYTISIDVTYRCTLRCLHCYNSSGETSTNKEELSDDELFSAIIELGKLSPRTLCYCGGEPLLRKDVLLSATKELRKVNRNININMVTNGELLTEAVADEIVESGITLVQVSLDGSKSDSHDWLRGKNGAYDKAISALTFLNERKRFNKEQAIHTAVSYIPNKVNIDEINDAMDLCESLGVEMFRVQPLMLLGRAKRNLSEHILSNQEYKILSKKLLERKRRNDSLQKMVIEWGDPIDHLLTAENTSYPFLAINAYGDILVSPYLPVTLGNIKNASIHEYISKGLFDKWSDPLIRYWANMILCPENMDISEKTDLPEIFHGFVNFDVLDEDFDLQMITEMNRIISERG